MEEPVFKLEENVIVRREVFHRRFEEPWVPSVVIKYIKVRPACYKAKAYNGAIGYPTAGEMRKQKEPK